MEGHERIDETWEGGKSIVEENRAEKYYLGEENAEQENIVVESRF